MAKKDRNTTIEVTVILLHIIFNFVVTKILYDTEECLSKSFNIVKHLAGPEWRAEFYFLLYLSFIQFPGFFLPLLLVWLLSLWLLFESAAEEEIFSF